MGEWALFMGTGLLSFIHQGSVFPSRSRRGCAGPTHNSARYSAMVPGDQFTKSTGNGYLRRFETGNAGVDACLFSCFSWSRVQWSADEPP